MNRPSITGTNHKKFDEALWLSHNPARYCAPMTTPPDNPLPNPLVVRIVDDVEARIEETVDHSVARTWAEVPAYPRSDDPTLRPDLRTHTRAVFDAVLSTMRKGRRATRNDFRITVGQARHRVGQGVELADFMQGFRIGQESLWEAIVDVARDDPDTRSAALDLAIHVMSVIETGSSVAAETFMAAQQMTLADDDRARRDLMEDLIAGRAPTAGPKADLLAVSGLSPKSAVMVVLAVPSTPLRADQSLRDALSTMRSTVSGGQQGLTVLRQDHILGITPIADDGSDLLAGLERAHRSLTGRGIHLSVGVSTVHDNLAGVQAAHHEAVLARESLAGESGVQALTALSPLDYLVLIGDDTAHRLIRPELRTFVTDDLADGGTQIETLRVYADCDLNAKIAAERLHIHVNTAYYRLERIAERTGCDLRGFADLQDLLVAIRLMTTIGGRQRRLGATGSAGPAGRQG